MTDKPKPFAHEPRFYSHLGWFYATWSAMELSVDFAIYKCLKIAPEQTHMLVAGLHFGPKAALLRSLLPTSDFKNGAQLRTLLKQISKESMRNIFTHSFIASDDKELHFIHRSSQGEYSAMGYKFTPDGFVAHIKAFVQLAADFEKALGVSTKELGDFAAAALKLEPGLDQRS